MDEWIKVADVGNKEEDAPKGGGGIKRESV